MILSDQVSSICNTNLLQEKVSHFTRAEEIKKAGLLGKHNNLKKKYQNAKNKEDKEEIKKEIDNVVKEINKLTEQIKELKK